MFSFFARFVSLPTSLQKSMGMHTRVICEHGRKLLKFVFDCEVAEMDGCIFFVGSLFLIPIDYVFFFVSLISRSLGSVNIHVCIW